METASQVDGAAQYVDLTELIRQFLVILGSLLVAVSVTTDFDPREQLYALSIFRYRAALVV